MPEHKLIERCLVGLVVCVVGLQILADVLPRIVVPVAVLASVFIVVRLVMFFTQRW